MLELLQYSFMQRALIAGIILAGVLALLGVYVLLKRMAFFADGIAHASLSGVAIGIIFSWYPLGVALVLSAIFALIIYFIERKVSIASDIAIGIIFSSGMALGILLISIQPGYQPELISFLFGNILAIKQSEIITIASLSIVIVLFFVKYYRQLTLLALDEELAHVNGIKVHKLLPIFYVALAVTVVLGIKILGVVLVSALLVLPAAIARVITKTFKSFMILSIIFSEVIVLSGIVTSFIFDLPTGPVIVLVGTILFIITASLSWYSQ